jgi:type VI secretion system secreted protein VgrG
MDEIITVSDLAGHPLHLRWMSGDEMLGGHLAGMFEYRLELESPADNIKAKDVLGQKLTINLFLPDDAGIRYFNGHVTSWSYRGKRHDNAIYRATIHPWLWFLNFTTDCRIFNKKSAIDIVKLIFRKYNDALFAESLVSTYPTHEFLVQYRESDLNLVCRLLQEEGAYFFFKHEAAQHTLVLADGISAHKTAPSCEEVPYVPPTSNARELRSHFERWKGSQDVQLQGYRVHDYDYEKARADLLAARNADPKQERVSIGEMFDYPARYREQSRGETIATLRLDELHEASQSIEVTGNPWELGAGHIVTVPNPPESDKPLKYLVTSAHYELRMPEERSGGAGGDEPPYTATYSLLPTTDQFRPRRVNVKPAIVGPQTAVVVGENKIADPEPEEIVTDPFGRIRVRFHWERIGPRHPEARGDEGIDDEKNTCWIRVAQLWAGPRWGAVFWPRVGQEVVVEFLEGDPDRPLITGTVYNNVNMPPYTLPDHKTQSGIKTRSTKGGTENNFNEIRFEDLKGKEELHIQAEKDMSTLVKHNQSTTVNVDRSVSVGGNHTVSVTGTQTTTITKKETQTYNAEREMKVALTNLDEITGAHTGTYHAGRTETVEHNDTLTVVGSDKKATVHGTYEITADTEYKLVQGTNSVDLKGNHITINNGKCEVHLEGPDATVMAKSSLTLKCGDASITLKNDGSIEINGKQKVNLSGGGSTVGLEQAGATMKGMKVGVTGSAVTEITGALIKIN